MEYIVIIPSILIAFCYWGLRKMCLNCFRWNGLRKTDNDTFTKTEYANSNQRVDIYDKNNNYKGHEIRQIQKAINIKYEKVTFECIKCKKTDKRILRPYQYFKEALVVFIIFYVIFLHLVNPPKEKKEILHGNEYNAYNNRNQSLPRYSSDTYEMKNGSNNKIEAKSKIENTESIAENNNTNNKIEETINHSTKLSEIDNLIKQDNINIAIDMLRRGKSIGKIKDSTRLTRREIKEIKKELKNQY